MKLTTTLATAAILALGVAAGPAQAAGKSPTQLNIKGQNGDYYGYVKSDNASCTSERKVKVFKMLGATPSPKTDQKIGSDVSDAVATKSKWSIGNSGYKHGSFYAKVGKTSDCRGKISKVITR